jgi:hypothetical protein
MLPDGEVHRRTGSILPSICQQNCLAVDDIAGEQLELFLVISAPMGFARQPGR